MANYLSPVLQNTFFSSQAFPGSGCQLFLYAAGTSTKQTAYQGSTTSTPWSNPIVLDSSGNLPSGSKEVWFVGGQTYKAVYAPSNDTDPPGSPIRTLDNLSGINDPSGISSNSEWVVGTTPTFVSGTSFTIVGDQTSTYHVGRRIKSTNTGGTVYSTVTSSAFTSLTTVGLVNDSSNLDSGLSEVAYGLLSATNPSTPLLADTYPIASGSADKSKKVRLEVDGITTGTTRVMTIPDVDGTLINSGNAASSGACMVLITSTTASNTSTFNFSLTSTYDFHFIEARNLVPTSSGVTLAMLMSTDNGATFQTAASTYAWATRVFGANGTDYNNSATADTAIGLNGGTNLLSNVPGSGGINLGIKLVNMASSTQQKHINYYGDYAGTVTYATENGVGIGQSTILTTTAVTAVQLKMSGQNISSGVAYLYGLRKA